MNLSDFERFIDPVITERGLILFDQDAFSEPTCDNQTFMMIAHGTDDYMVSVKLDQNNVIINHACTCPYDHGPICKHIVALLYWIREEHFKETRVGNHDSAAVLVEDRIETIIRSLGKKTLEDILILEAYQNEQLFKSLTYRFDKEDNKINLARATVIEAMDLVESSDHYHMSDDDLWDNARGEIDEIFDEALNSESVSYAIRLLMSVMIEASNTSTPYSDV